MALEFDARHAFMGGRGSEVGAGTRGGLPSEEPAPTTSSKPSIGPDPNRHLDLWLPFAKTRFNQTSSARSDPTRRASSGSTRLR